MHLFTQHGFHIRFVLFPGSFGKLKLIFSFDGISWQGTETLKVTFKRRGSHNTLQYIFAEQLTRTYKVLVPQYLPVLFKVLPGCDCCEVDGKLVEDGTTWIRDGKIFECCRGEIVMKVETPHEEFKGWQKYIEFQNLHLSNHLHRSSN